MRLRRVIWNPWQRNGKLRNMKNQSFEVLCHKQNLECKEGKQREICHEAFFMTVMSATFGALYGIQFIHAICRFEVQKVKNPMLQTVRYSELKWRSYSRWKPITASWKQISQHCEISLGLWKWCPFAAKFHSPLAVEFLLKLPDMCDRHFEIFCFRYLMSKSLNSPCNPPIIGFLSL